MLAVSGSMPRLAVLLPLLAALGACETSSRLGSLMPGSNVGSAPRVSQRGAPAPLTPAPVGEVYTSDLGGGASSSALPPPSSAPSVSPAPSLPSASARAGGLSAPGNLPAGGGTLGSPIDPPPASGSAPAAGGPTYYPSGTAPATNPVPAPPPRVATAPSGGGEPSRTSVIGNWSVSEAAGGSCRITLSSAPKLDLYGAGTSGCQGKELQRVNAWELSGSELLLYEPGGGVVARMRRSGSGYAGATAKTGAPVSISK